MSGMTPYYVLLILILAGLAALRWLPVAARIPGRDAIVADLPAWGVALLLVWFSLAGLHALQSRQLSRHTEAPSNYIPFDRMTGLRMEQGWGSMHVDRSTDDNDLRIGGVQYERGFGTHAPSVIRIPVPAGATAFSAMVGIDDESPGGEVALEVRGDDRLLWKSPRVKGGSPALEVQVPTEGVRYIELRADPLGPIDDDHVDWVNGGFLIGN